MAEEVAPPAPEAAPRRTPKWLLLVVSIVLAVVGLGLGVGVIGPLLVRREQVAKAATLKAAPKDAAGTVHLLENLVLNPAGTGGTRFLMVSVAIETRDAAVNDEMNERDAEVRDATLQLLAGKTVDELADVSRRPALRQELLVRLSRLFAPGAIRQIYFPQFVIQ